MLSSSQESLVSPNSALQSYYGSLESRIGYRLFLGGTRHFAYYPEDTWWPFPLSDALRSMEDQLFWSLGVRKGAKVLDAGCGVGHVAIHMAKKGLVVRAIDIVDRHVQKAQRNVKLEGLDDSISVQAKDFHNLDGIEDQSLDGVYTMETLVHATDPEQVLREFFRTLKPGGRLALHEYDHIDLDTAPPDLKKSMNQVNKYSAMPSNDLFDRGVLEKLLVEAGFQDVETRDLSPNIKPLLRLFYLVAFLPFIIIRLLGLESWFVNTMAGVEGYRGLSVWRYISVTAKKPQDEEQKPVRKRAA